jgi:imidazolonepropionase-like amidohydrolase
MIVDISFNKSAWDRHAATCQSLCILFIFLFSAILSNAQITVIHCGNLIDGRSETALGNSSIVIDGNRITAVQKGFIRLDTIYTLINLYNKTVLPGFIDLHVHLESETSRDAATKRFTQNEADIAFQSLVYAKKTLMAGFTTVRDLGGSGVNISL